MAIFPTLPPRLPLRVPTEKSCCTCARLLSEVPRYGEDEKKISLEDRTLKCCDRVICGVCIQKNTRFAFYCPYCPDQDNFPGAQSNSGSSSPCRQNESSINSRNQDTAWSASSPASSHSILAASETKISASLPSSSIPMAKAKLAAKAEMPPARSQEVILHHIHPHETLISIALLYRLTPGDIRRANGLSPTGLDDRLIFARKTAVIPGRTRSLSMVPPGGEEAEHRRMAIRRWMMATKEPDYDVAKTYLEGLDWDVARAVDRWFGDAEWERENGRPPYRKMSQDEKRGERKKAGGWLGFLGI